MEPENLTGKNIDLIPTAVFDFAKHIAHKKQKFLHTKPKFDAKNQIMTPQKQDFDRTKDKFVAKRHNFVQQPAC